VRAASGATRGLNAMTQIADTSGLSPLADEDIVRLNEELRRRIKMLAVLPCTEAVPIPLWSRRASGQIQMRKVDGWETLSEPPEPMPLDLAA